MERTIHLNILAAGKHVRKDRHDVRAGGVQDERSDKCVERSGRSDVDRSKDRVQDAGGDSGIKRHTQVMRHFGQHLWKRSSAISGEGPQRATCCNVTADYANVDADQGHSHEANGTVGGTSSLKVDLSEC